MAGALPPVAPRTDLRSGFAWIALGAVAVFASWRMDRFEQQGATLHSAPGLWPGIVGLIIALLGGALAWRAVLRAHQTGWRAAQIDEAQLVPRSQLALAAAMFLTYALLLVGHGLPFWLGTGAFVTLFVFAFRRAERLARGSPGSNRADAMLALSCGAATALVVTYTFENLFYVRLP
jgi:hypothetical protein